MIKQLLIAVRDAGLFALVVAVVIFVAPMIVIAHVALVATGRAGLIEVQRGEARFAWDPLLFGAPKGS